MATDIAERLALEVKSFVKGLGADLVGIAPVERFERAPAGYKPQDILPGTRSVIVFAFRLLESTFISPNPRIYIMRYWQLRSRLQDIGYDVCRHLEDKGYYAVNLPSTAPQDIAREKGMLFGDFSYKHAAVEAGLGQIGWNQLLITPQFGPRVWLMAVLTDAILYPDERFNERLCLEEECAICIRECPEDALSPQGMDKRKCARRYGEFGLYGLLKHINTILKETDSKKRDELIFGTRTWGLWMQLQYGGGPSRCNVCVSVCPVGRKDKLANL